MVDRARAGEGASLIGIDTMRMQGHAQHDDARYVPKELLDEWADEGSDRAIHAGTWSRRGAATEKELDDIDAMTKSYAAEEARPGRGVADAGPGDASRAASTPATTSPCRRVELVKSPFAEDVSRWQSSPTSRRSARRCSTRWRATSACSCIGEDIGAYGGAFKVTDGLHRQVRREARRSTRRSRKQAIVGSAIGASYMGMRPVCEIQFIDFIACCFDMLTNFAATSRYRNGAGVPIVVRGPCGGGVGGGPFHSLNPEAFFLNTPGLKMVEPSTAYDAKGLLKAAIRDDDPVLYFEHKFLYRRIKDEVPDEDYIVPIGKAAVRREGSDLSIITFGAMVYTALDAAKQLAEQGVAGRGARPAQPRAARSRRDPDIASPRPAGCCCCTRRR